MANRCHRLSRARSVYCRRTALSYGVSSDSLALSTPKSQSSKRGYNSTRPTDFVPRCTPPHPLQSPTIGDLSFHRSQPCRASHVLCLRCGMSSGPITDGSFT